MPAEGGLGGSREAGRREKKVFGGSGGAGRMAGLLRVGAAGVWLVGVGWEGGGMEMCSVVGGACFGGLERLFFGASEGVLFGGLEPEGVCFCGFEEGMTSWVS